MGFTKKREDESDAFLEGLREFEESKSEHIRPQPPTAKTVPVLITKEVECCQCGDEFVLTVSEQRFFYQKGLHLPKRCRACRALNKKNNRLST